MAATAPAEPTKLIKFAPAINSPAVVIDKNPDTWHSSGRKASKVPQPPAGSGVVPKAKRPRLTAAKSPHPRVGGAFARSPSGSAVTLSVATGGPHSTPPRKELTGAESRETITHGLTMRGAQLTWAVLEGVKVIENRHFRLKPGWYALHTRASLTSS
jgi:hypothetical protein